MKTPPRQSQVARKTAETDISLRLLLDGSGHSQIRTRIPFFDHMLTLLSKHALWDLDLTCQGDIEVDFHHTVEDCGIALGQAFAQALGDKCGIRRYGHAYAPMDETLVRVALDVSGRPFLAYRVKKSRARAGNFPIQLVEEFCRGFCVHSAMNLHVELLYGKEAHHIAEAIFKGLAKALDAAATLDPRVQGVPSTKGSL